MSDFYANYNAQKFGKCPKVWSCTPVPTLREKWKSFLFFFQKQKDWNGKRE